MMYVSSLLPEILVGAALVSAGGSFLRTALAIRTKSHLKKKIHALGGSNADVRHWINVRKERHLVEPEIHQARITLKKLAASMPKRDRAILYEGIEQSSRAGARNFIDGLFART